MKKMLHTILYCILPFVTWAQNDYDPFNNEGFGRERPRVQKDSSVKEGPVVPHFRTAWQWRHGGLYKQVVPLDSLTDGIHNYNVIFKRAISNTYLGNYPSPYESNIFIHRERNETFYPLNTVRAYLFKPEDALEFNVTTPFTRIDYFNGGGSSVSENWLDVWHVQNIKPYWSAGFRYNLISSLGSYAYQKSKAYNFAFFSGYEHRRLAASFFINQNMGHFDENGGVAEFSEIRDTIINSRYVLTRLTGSDKGAYNNNNYQNFNLNVLVQYNIGKGRRVDAYKDSLLNARGADTLLTEDLVPDSPLQNLDSLLGTNPGPGTVDSLLSVVPPPPTDSLSTDTLYAGAMTYPMKATLAVRVEENKHAFKESTVDRAFFPHHYIDSLSNKNLYANKTVEVEGKLILNEHPRYYYLPGLYAGLTYKQRNYRQRKQVDQDSTTVDFGTDNYYGAYLTAGIFNIDTTDLLHFDAAGSLCLLGDYIADYALQGEITQFLRRDRNTFIKIKGALKRTTPNVFLEFYLGNHDRWANNFDKTASYELEGSFHHTRHRTEFGINLNNTTGYIYFDTLPTPRQYDASLFVLTAWAKQTFKLGNFYFDQNVYYQVSNQPDVLSLPQLSLYSHNYYKNIFFKKALGFQIGVDLFYNTSFYASSYAPSIMQFHEQRKEKTGNYPKVDVFIALRIKRADIFVKYEHLSQYFANRNYFSAYAYPINPARLKYGIRWNFFD
ncbi:MAG: putative porin [Odoribacteraceae bacterium]|jgi:hypothetical protein|nr:putative porin [Odoribacteraceae bacterium]